MRTKLTCIFLLCCLLAAAQDKKVAISKPRSHDSNIPSTTLLMLRNKLSQAVTNTTGYRAYERANMDVIFEEVNFQESGIVSEDEIHKLKEGTGADYVLYSEVAIIEGHSKLFGTSQQYYISASILDLNRQEIIATADRTMGMTISDIQNGCKNLANDLLANSQQTVVTPTEKPKKQEPVVAQSDLLTRLSSKEYEYQGTVLDKKAYKQFLFNNCKSAYSRYKKGNVLIGTGWGFFAGSFLLAGGATACLIISNNRADQEYQLRTSHDHYNSWTEETLAESNQLLNEADNFEILAIALYSGSGATLTTGITLLSVGYGMRNNAYKTFNKQCASRQGTLSLNLCPKTNGIGLALQF